MNIKAALSFLACLAAGLSLATAQNANDRAQPVPAETQVLQGTWEGVEAGREAEGKCRMTVTGNTLHFQGVNEKEWYKATFSLSAESEPKQLRAKITECSVPEFVGKTAASIFKVEDGKLTITGNKPGLADAPKSFEAENGARSITFTKVPSAK
jgi:uncharacterized protein (TIGR03067 family)